MENGGREQEEREGISMAFSLAFGYPSPVDGQMMEIENWSPFPPKKPLLSLEFFDFPKLNDSPSPHYQLFPFHFLILFFFSSLLFSFIFYQIKQNG